MEKNSHYLRPLVIVGTMFFILGFAIGINNLMIPFLRTAFNLTTASSYLVMAATYTAFLLFGYPSGVIIRRIGYRRAIACSFLLFAVGMYLFIPSATNGSFFWFLGALFVGGMGNTLLQTAVNPYVTILGPGESAAKRLSIMGIANKTANAAAPVVLALFLNLKEVELTDVILPFYLLAAVMLLLGIASCFFPLPEVQAEGESADDTSSGVAAYVRTKKHVWQFPQLTLGMAALFFDVGLEMIALGTIVDYAYMSGLAHPETYTLYTTAFMILGYCIGIVLIPRYLSQHKALLYCAVLGGVASLGIVFAPVGYSIWLVALLGLANSMLWPAIWPLAIADLGRFTKTASSLMITVVAGGAFVPLLFGWLTDVFQNMQRAYWICLPMYLYLLFYAVKGYRMR